MIPSQPSLVGAEVRSVRRWLDGYTRTHGGIRRSAKPLWPMQYAGDQKLGDEQVLGFDDLLELRTVARFMALGVSLNVIRATIEVARDELGEYPLHSRRFVTDGHRIFMEAVERANEDSKLLDVRGRQYALGEIIRPSLLDGIEFDQGDHALRWFPVPGERVVVLDPCIQFGASIVVNGGVPTDALAAAFRAEGGDVGRVARLYRVEPLEVKAAVAFEDRMAYPQAA
jgi:uncharacterized protein (DUF433 family)